MSQNRPDGSVVLYVRIPDKTVVEKFDKLYPGQRSLYIARSLERAISSKDLVMNILFGD